MVGVAGFPAHRQIDWLAGLLQGLDFLTQDAVASCTHQQFNRHRPFLTTREASPGNAAAGQRTQERIVWPTAGKRERQGTQGRRGEKAISHHLLWAPWLGVPEPTPFDRLPREKDPQSRQSPTTYRSTDLGFAASHHLTTHHRDHVPHLGTPAGALLKAVIDTINETRIPSCAPCADRARRRTPSS